MKKDRNKIIPLSYLILVRDNKILMLRRFNTGYCDGSYSLPAGHVEKNESFTQCIIREAKEEANVILNEVNVEAAVILNINYGMGNERVHSFFSATKWRGEVKNMEPEKCDDLSWFDLDNLPKNMAPEVKLALENFKVGKIYDEYGWE